jgi:hypothetical protein
MQVGGGSEQFDREDIVAMPDTQVMTLLVKYHKDIRRHNTLQQRAQQLQHEILEAAAELVQMPAPTDWERAYEWERVLPRVAKATSVAAPVPPPPITVTVGALE